jgi:hypothetical protein
LIKKHPREKRETLKAMDINGGEAETPLKDSVPEVYGSKAVVASQ